MKQVMTGVLSMLFAIGLSGAATAGMMDALEGKAEGTNKASTEALKGMGTKDVAVKEAEIKAQNATKGETGGMMDKIKTGAKGEVNKTKETANETIDNIGK